MSSDSTWVRVTRTSPCEICRGKSWCGITTDGGTVRCMRATEGGKVHPAGGRTFRLKDTDFARVRIPEVVLRPWPNLEALVTAGIAATDDRRLGALAEEHALPNSTGLGALRLLRAWTPRSGIAAFPMIGPAGRACGIRYRSRSGGRWSESGGRDGLFRPVSMIDGASLLLPEGATDSVALASLGFAVVGRSSCSSGADLAMSFVRQLRPPSVVVVADRDEPGQLGAHALAQRLALLIDDTCVLTPPGGFKDARAWVAGGATRADVEAAIVGAERIRLGWEELTR